MNNRITAVLAGALLALTSHGVHADGVAGGLAAGTLGLGAQVAFALREDINLRLGVNGISFNRSAEYHSVDYDDRVKLFNVPLVVDWFPTKGIFRLSAGVAANDSKIQSEGRPQSGVYVIGNNTYSATQIGSVNGEAKWEGAAPYLGVGWGNPVQRGKKFGWNLDLGLMYIGKPKTTYTVVCGTAVNCAQLQADAAIEAGNFDHDLSRYQLYPVAQFYLTWQF